VLACSVYVDLNPIRAGIAATPEQSDFTSGCDRIRGLEVSSAEPGSSRDEHSLETSGRPDDWLCELTIQETAIGPATAPAQSSPPGQSESIAQAEPIATDLADVAIDLAPSTSPTPASAQPAEAGSRWRLGARASDQGFLPIETRKYIMLLDWTGRELRRGKRGAIPQNLAPILDRLGIDRSNWVDTVRDFGRMFKQAAGRASSLARAAPRCSRRWFQGKASAQLAFL
jgi:hypothetical protein